VLSRSDAQESCAQVSISTRLPLAPEAPSIDAALLELYVEALSTVVLLVLEDVELDVLDVLDVVEGGVPLAAVGLKVWLPTAKPILLA
jgi:hypothetical protein